MYDLTITWPSGWVAREERLEECMGMAGSLSTAPKAHAEIAYCYIAENDAWDEWHAHPGNKMFKIVSTEDFDIVMWLARSEGESLSGAGQMYFAGIGSRNSVDFRLTDIPRAEAATLLNRIASYRLKKVPAAYFGPSAVSCDELPERPAHKRGTWPGVVDSVEAAIRDRYEPNPRDTPTDVSGLREHFLPDPLH